tara:strand:- start:1348 stop:2217 length:870 start_codon:yes stop_codon:yes gene_type:complete
VGIALGGYGTFAGDFTYLSSPSYKEPGFDVMFPLRLSVPSSMDIVFLLIRSRYGGTYDNLLGRSYQDYTIAVTNALTGEPVYAVLSPNNISDNWDIPGWSPVVANLRTRPDADTTVSHQDMKVVVTDNKSDEFVSCRVILGGESLPFYIMAINKSNFANRVKYSSYVSNGYVQVDPRGSYAILSPSGNVFETTQSNSNFSYPLNKTYYKHQPGRNAEDYAFTIIDYSDTSIEGLVTIRNAVNYGNIGILDIDSFAYDQLKALEAPGYVNIQVTGRSSGISRTMRIYLAA